MIIHNTDNVSNSGDITDFMEKYGFEFVQRHPDRLTNLVPAHHGQWISLRPNLCPSAKSTLCTGQWHCS